MRPKARAAGAAGIDASEYTARLDRLRGRLLEIGTPVFLVSGRANIRYLTGFTGSAGWLLVAPGEATLFTDGRYDIQSRQQTSGIEISISHGNAMPAVVEAVKEGRLRQIAFERNRASFHEFQLLKDSLPRRRFVPLDGVVEGFRAVKSDAEIELIRRSVKLNSKAFDNACRQVKPDWTEARLAAEIEYQMRLLGAERASFETIVASGPRSALPHAQPGAAKLAPDSLIVIDQGAILDGYASDMTRMAALGRLGKRERNLYRAVLEAQEAAVGAMKAGVRAKSVDAAARRVLRGHKLDEAFTHSTGHGVGLEIHEGPRLAPEEDRLLGAGMVVTIEPGAYLEGLGGVRIEDMAVVTSQGCEVLTPTPKRIRSL